MAKKWWIIFSIVCVAVIGATLTGILLLVPQVQDTGEASVPYDQIAKQEYAFTGKETQKLEQQYNITSKDVSDALKKDKYDEGNINPFTPKGEVTIYNEPTLNKNNGSSLSPSDK